jgi:hypothetical protein
LLQAATALERLLRRPRHVGVQHEISIVASATAAEFILSKLTGVKESHDPLSIETLGI